MTQKTTQIMATTPYHVRKWLDSRLSITEKPHKINEKVEVWCIAKNFTIVKK